MAFIGKPIPSPDGFLSRDRSALRLCAKTGLHLLTDRSMIALVDNAESGLAGRERHVVGDDRLGETL
jgi:hypothetical protein